MRRPLSLLLLAALSACAWRPFGDPSDGRIRPVQVLSDEGNHSAVVAALTPQFMQTLRGTDLRQAYVLLGENLDKLGRRDEALGVYQVGVNLFPLNVDLLTRTAEILHRDGLDERARPLFQRALAREPRHYGAHLGLAEIDRALGFLDRSAGHYEDALETVGQNARVWRDYSEVLIAQREYKTAALALDKSDELEPGNADAEVLRGFTLRAQGDLHGAIARLDRALALGAGTPARRAKALWLLEAGRLSAAAAEADAVLRETPGDPAALWVRARTLWASGRGERAADELRELADGRRHDFPARAARALREAILARPSAAGSGGPAR
jgi:tetratricopeptide (TPR) repeat protein